MAPSSSDAPPRRHGLGNEDGVSEVIGFLLTFGIISAILLVAMLGFNDAQQRAEVRLVEIQGSSAAQRVAAASVDLALFANQHPVRTEVAIDLPAELQGISYSVLLCQDGNACECEGAATCPAGTAFCLDFACPYVKVESFRGDPQRQSTFLLLGMQFCAQNNSASGGVVLVTYYPPNNPITGEPDDCIGLRDETV